MKHHDEAQSSLAQGIRRAVLSWSRPHPDQFELFVLSVPSFEIMLPNWIFCFACFLGFQTLSFASVATRSSHDLFSLPISSINAEHNADGSGTFGSIVRIPVSLVLRFY